MGDWAFPASGTGWQEDPWQELGDASPLALTDQRVHVTPLPFNMLPGMADAPLLAEADLPPRPRPRGHATSGLAPNSAVCALYYRPFVGAERIASR